MHGQTLSSWGSPAEGMGDCFHIHCQAWGWDRIGCTAFRDGSHTLFDSEAPPWLVFDDWAISVHYEVLCLLFSWMRSLIPDPVLPFWPFSWVLSQVFWRECLTEMPESVWVPFPLLGLLELCQLAYLQYWVLCLTHPRLALYQDTVRGKEALGTPKSCICYPVICVISVCVKQTPMWSTKPKSPWDQKICMCYIYNFELSVFVLNILHSINMASKTKEKREETTTINQPNREEESGWK